MNYNHHQIFYENHNIEWTTSVQKMTIFAEKTKQKYSIWFML